MREAEVLEHERLDDGLNLWRLNVLDGWCG